MTPADYAFIRGWRKEPIGPVKYVNDSQGRVLYTCIGRYGAALTDNAWSILRWHFDQYGYIDGFDTSEDNVRQVDYLTIPYNKGVDIWS